MSEILKYCRIRVTTDEPGVNCACDLSVEPKELKKITYNDAFPYIFTCSVFTGFSSTCSAYFGSRALSFSDHYCQSTCRNVILSVCRSVRSSFSSSGRPIFVKLGSLCRIWLRSKLQLICIAKIVQQFGGGLCSLSTSSSLKCIFSGNSCRNWTKF